MIQRKLFKIYQRIPGNIGYCHITNYLHFIIYVQHIVHILHISYDKSKIHFFLQGKRIHTTIEMLG